MGDLVASRLLTHVFTGLEDSEKITVLDVGPGQAPTLNFLSQFPSRVYFADLYALDVTLDDPDAGDATREAHALREFDKALQLSADTVIDVCLFWDYLHCLNLPALRALSAALSPHLHRGSRGYAFGALHSHTPMDHSDYSIHDLTHLRRSAATYPPFERPHTQKTLSEHFIAFQVAKGTLMSEGRLELFLETI
jgi:hypothetical protein